MPPLTPAEGDTTRRAYEIWAFATDGSMFIKFLQTVDAVNHEAALRAWGKANPDDAAACTSGFKVITASASKSLGGDQQTTFVVRPLADPAP